MVAPPDHHVLRFDVPVDDARLVRRVERRRDLCGDVQNVVQFQAAARHVLPQRHAVNVLRDDEARRARLAEVVNRQDVRMCEAGDGARLLHEALHAAGVGGYLGGEQLDGDGALQLARVLREIDLAHPARAYLLADFVAA